MPKFSGFSKKTIAFITAIVVILSSIVVSMAVASSSDLDVWDKSVATSFAGGSGTSVDPYLIAIPEQLAKMVKGGDTKGGYYKLTADIYLNDVSKADWASDSPNEWYDRADINNTAFVGNLDGDGHTIYGLFYDGTNIVGLFPQAKDTTISNLRISNSDIKSSGAVSALISFGQNSVKFDRCIVDETVKLTNTATNNEAGVAGFIAYGSPKVKIENSAVMATITATNRRGAFIGNVWGNTAADRLIKNSFNAVNTALLAHNTQGFTVENVYTVGTEHSSQVITGTVNKLASADMMKGAAAKTNMPNLNWKGTWQTTENGYPTFKDAEGAKGEVWTGNVASGFAGGTGTATDPYLIETAEQLARMVKIGDTKGGYYKLTADIYLNDVSTPNWPTKSPIRWYDRADINNTAFVGNLDGDGYTIHGLYYDGKNIVGLFPQAKDTTISNLRISNSDIKSSGAVSALISFGQGTVNFKKCIIDETVKLTNTVTSGEVGVAGFVAYGSPKIFIEDSAVMATITGAYRNGAFIGNVWGNTAAERSIKNSFSAVNTALSAHPTQGFTVEKVYTVGTEHPAQAITGTVNKLASADMMKGAAAKTNMPDLNWVAVWRTTTDGYPTHMGEVELDPNRWDGTTATKFADGDGTKEKPFVITNAAELAKMVTDGDATSGKYYVLANDIKINDVTVESWQSYAKQWNITTKAFQGTFDGAGYTIYGLYYDGADNYAGLIARVKGTATIKNLFLSDFDVKSSGFGVSALVGFIHSGTKLNISRVYTDENISVVSTSTNSTDGSAAGFIAYGSGTITIDSSAFLGTVECAYQKASFIGNVWNSTKVITNSFATPAIPFNSKQAISDSSKGNYGVGTSLAAENGVTRLEAATDMQGATAKSKMPKLNWINVWKTSATGYPVYMAADEIDASIWDGTIANEFAGGDGSEKNPYKIANGAQLAKMATDGDATADKYYVLTADIKLNDVSAENWKDFATAWVGTDGVFQGTLDGDGHTVYGIYYKGSDKESIGLVSRAKGSVTFKRIIISDTHIEATNKEGSASAFIGWINGGTTARFERCYITDSVYCKTANTAGGFVANGSGKIYVENCASLGHFEATKRYGSMVGGIYWSDATARTVSINKSFSIEPYTNYWIEKIVDSYATQKLPADSKLLQPTILNDVSMIKGDAAKKNMPALDWKNIWIPVNNKYPSLNFTVYTGTVGGVWSGAVAEKYAGGTGTKNDPYIIETPEQLAKLCSNLTICRDKHYKLTADIYLNDVSKKNWKEKSPNQWFWSSASKDTGFDGHFDGNGHVIYGMYLDLIQTTEVVYAGLFSAITDGAYIEKVGISDSYMKVTTTDDTTQSHYIAGIAGSVFYKDNNAPRDPAYISQCFGSTSVEFEGWGCGGIVHGMPRPCVIEDCYFVGKLTYTLKGGGIIGDTWMETQYTNAAVRRCYSATADSDYLAAGRAGVSNSFSSIAYKDNYSTYLGLSSFQTRISMLMMRGEAAKKNMTGLDFDKVWYAVPNGTPVLRVFGTTDKFSNTADPKPIEVSFVSNGGTECENMYGNPEEPLKLPTPTKKGYKFAGWYVYKELDIEYTYDFFPYFDQMLYAKWERSSNIQDFEDYANTKYDYGEDYEYFRPGTAGYDSTYIKSGTSSMHRKGLISDSADFLVFYDQLLKVGTKYEMIFYINTDKEGTDVDLSLVHEDFPDIYDSDSGVELIKSIDTVKVGEWTKVTYKFTAKTQWIAIRTSGDASIFFDDFMVTALGDDANVSVNNGDTNNGNSGIIWIIVLVAAAVLILAAGAVIVVIVIKKSKNKN